MWGELSWGELSLGRDVCNSPRHGLQVNSVGFCLLNRKLKSGKNKVLNICVCFDTISIKITSDQVLVFTCCSTKGKTKIKYSLTIDVIGLIFMRVI